MRQLHKPPSELQQLSFLVGQWHTVGEVKATTSHPSIRIKGTDTYEWIVGGFFLLHRADVLIGDENVEVIEIIGYDDSGKTYPMRSFDNQGNFITMQATVEQDGVMNITGEMMRATLAVGKDGNQMTAHWERSEDGTRWLPWMDMRFNK